MKFITFRSLCQVFQVVAKGQTTPKGWQRYILLLDQTKRERVARDYATEGTQAHTG